MTTSTHLAFILRFFVFLFLIGTACCSEIWATLTQEVWIAIRADGHVGSGTQADPYDGSSAARFDAVMNSISPNAIIHLGAGTFPTHGAMTWRPKNNWTISGAGMYQTVVMQTAIQSGAFQVINGAGGAWGLVAANFTIDCNYMNLSPTLNSPDKSIGAISAISGHFYNVRGIHAGGTHETFTLGFAQYGAGSIPPSSVLIENCRVEQSGPHVTAIFASNSQTNDNSDTVPAAGQAIIRNCYVEGNGDRATGGIAFQVNGYQSGVIDGCSTVGCTYSVYRDTCPQAGVTVANCNISAVIHAISLVGARTDNVLIQGNTLAAGEIIVDTEGATNVTIQGNSFLPGPQYNNWWQPVRTICSTYIANNRLEPAITNGSGWSTLGRMYDNRYFDGSIVPFLPDTAPVSASPSDFNRDDKADWVLYKSSTHQTAIWYMNNVIKTNSAYGPSLGPGWTLVGSADFDGDRNPDYVLFNPTTRRTAIWYLSGATFLRSAFGPTLPANWQLVSVGDFNFDSKPDYLLYNLVTRRTAIWYLNNNVFVSSAFAPAIWPGWQLVATSDFNGDTSPDYLLFNPGSRRSAIWYLCEGSLMSKAFGPTIASGYALVGAGDFNSDGKPDYVLYNSATRRPALWYMNDNVLISGTNTPPLTAGWSLVIP